MQTVFIVEHGNNIIGVCECIQSAHALAFFAFVDLYVPDGIDRPGPPCEEGCSLIPRETIEDDALEAGYMDMWDTPYTTIAIQEIPLTKLHDIFWIHIMNIKGGE
jgi:hypothetical protein